jgi:hypothetical protein
MVGQAVQNRGCHFGVSENLWPVGEGEICGDQQGGVFVELSDQVKQQLAAGLAEWQMTQLIDDDDVVAQQLS